MSWWNGDLYVGLSYHHQKVQGEKSIFAWVDQNETVCVLTVQLIDVLIQLSQDPFVV